MVPLKDLVVFPRMVVPLFVGRRKSLHSVEEAMRLGRPLFLVAQRKTSADEPDERDVHSVGTVSRVLQILKLPDGKVRLLVEGLERAAIAKYAETRDSFRVVVRPLPAVSTTTPQVSALMRAALSQFTRYTEVSKKVPPEAVTAVESAELPDTLVDLIAGNLPLKLPQKLELLSIEDTEARLEKCAAVVAAEIEVLTLEQEITGKVRRKLEKTQKDYFLNEQLKEIQRELGAEGDDPTGARELEEKVKAKGLPAEVTEKCQKELRRLGRMQPMSPESALLRTYLEWIVDLPWKETTADNHDIERARQILDEDHYDLKKVKERILDFIAVRQLSSGVKGPILCFIGPPGTGKTSLGRSVARSLGRNFVRVSLGGVRDEAEIRGHRKTYVGALPGKIIQSMRKAGSRNPVFLLDEIDKMSADWRGDPASALLEVLDPEQNAAFVDHYLEVPYDLSRVMFITTANSSHNIPYPLRDRMEVIEISGYTEFEKEKIAERFLVPKQIRENGLDWADITFHKSGILKLIRGFTMEAGVRSLEREIANIIRKIAREAVKQGRMPPTAVQPELSAVEGEQPTSEAPTEAAQSAVAAALEVPVETPAAPAPAAPPPAEPFKVTVTGRNVEKFLGKVKFLENTFSRDVKPGLAYGLAWTEVGGQLLPVEVAILEGKGELMLTGSLGDVMKESAQAALSFLRAHHAALGIPADFTKDRDIHIHVPEGAIPKDGPSAGITLAAALLSAVTGVALKSGFAMTGEITLTGRLLPIGGVKEKVLAAHRYKMTHVLLPRRNEKDLEEIPAEVQQDLDFELADSVLDAIAILFPKGSFTAEMSEQEAAEPPEEKQEDRGQSPDGPAAPDDDVPLTQPSV
ncbi:MAG TPA: endopeptidase La [Spirochaetia bacterium]|nr:endopeptidase La [Spirochaetia bacterium]